MAPTANQFSHGCKMVTEQLKYRILKEAVQNNLLPTALMEKLDIGLEELMDALTSLLEEGCLTLTEGKWIAITDAGREAVTREEEKIKEEGLGEKNYYENFFTRWSGGTVGINEPYMPSIGAMKQIMEGAGKKETSN